MPLQIKGQAVVFFRSEKISTVKYAPLIYGHLVAIRHHKGEGEAYASHSPLIILFLFLRGRWARKFPDSDRVRLKIHGVAKPNRQ